MLVGEPVRRQLLDMQFRAMTMAYRSAFPAGRFDIITLNKAPIGRLITDNDPARFHIVYVALLPEWRDRRIGTVLMTSVLAEPQLTGTCCEVTVALDNHASLSLWSRLGFIERERTSTDLIVEWHPEP